MPSSKKSPATTSSAPMPVAPLLVNIKTAAQMLSTTEWRIRSLVWDKKLPVVTLGGRRFLFRPCDLNAFVNQQAGQ